jgi:hypothetical protein
MNKLFSKIAALSVGLAMAVGVGVALGHESVREVRAEELAQSYDLSSALPSSLTASTTLTVDQNGRGMGKASTTWTLTTSSSFTKVTSIVVNAATNGTLGSSYSLSVTVGGSSFDSGKQLSQKASTNYTFSDSEATGSVVISANNTAGTKTIWIKTVEIYVAGSSEGPFTVTYNGNGATSGSMSDSTEYDSGATVTIMACGYMRTDYEVTGWNTKADGTGTAYGLSAQFTITSNVTLYAQWNYVGKGSEGNPYTVAQAKAAVDAGTFPTPAYVSGIIAQIDAYKSSYHSIDYWISDDGTTTSMLESYSGKGLNGADFNAKEDIEVGATVVLCGTLKIYKGTYELDINNYQVSYAAPVHEDPTLMLDSVKGHLVLGSGSHSSTTVTASFESFSGTPTVSVVGEPAKVNVSIDGASITITAKSAGVETVTFRATYNSEVADVEYKVAVTTNEGTAVNPFTVSEARNVLDAMETVTGYVLGAISQIDSFSSQYSSITYWISDDGTTTDQLQCYSGKGYNGANFSSKDDLTTGTMVVVSGTLKIFKSTYEFDKNNRITEFSRVENLATEILNRTYNVCHDYDDVTDNHDAIAAIWEILAGSGYYGDFTDTEKAFIQSIEAKEDGEFLEQAMARYDYLTGKYKLTNFINGRTPAESGFVSVSSFGSSNNSYIIIIVISAVSVMSFGLALFLRKKRSK